MRGVRRIRFRFRPAGVGVSFSCMTDADATALPADARRTPMPHRAIRRVARRRVLWLAASTPLMMGTSMTADAATPTGATLLTAPLSLAG